MLLGALCFLGSSLLTLPTQADKAQWFQLGPREHYVAFVENAIPVGRQVAVLLHTHPLPGRSEVTVHVEMLSGGVAVRPSVALTIPGDAPAITTVDVLDTRALGFGALVMRAWAIDEESTWGEASLELRKLIGEDDLEPYVWSLAIVPLVALCCVCLLVFLLHRWISRCS